MENLNLMILVPVFLVLLVVIYQAIASMSMFDTLGSCVLSVCVTLLCIIGMASFWRDSSLTVSSFQTILLPYAALAFTVPLVWILILITRCYTAVRMRLMSRALRKQTCEGRDRRLKSDKHGKPQAKSLQL